MEAFLTFILFLFLFFWLVTRFGPILLAWWLKRKFGGYAGDKRGYYEDENKYKEGDTIIDNISKPQNKVVDKNMGEYVDFEETKEDNKEKSDQI
jgi:hypothetical protein